MQYAYHSNDENFPGTIEIQKKQWPDARWLPDPENNKHGGRVMGFLPNGNEVHEWDNVLVTHQKVAPYDEKLHYIDRARLARKRAVDGLTKRGKPTVTDRALANVRLAHQGLSNFEFVQRCARGEIEMGNFHSSLQAIAQRMLERRQSGLTEQSKRMSGDTQ